ncbi:hypothetical protein JADG_000110 [Aureobasidium aubasidani]|nr:hypothetical protein JADG_000110 [Aureobasidium pullulans]
MTSSHPLPPDLLESQISTVDLLLAMFPEPNESDISQSDLALITTIRDEGAENITSIPSGIDLAVHVTLDATHSIQVNITAPLRSTQPSPPEPPEPTFSLRQPTWLDKASLSDFTSSLPTDIFSALDYLRDSGPTILPSTTPSTTSKIETSSAPLVRVWFYFPSLSTREKRNHMVSWAPSHHLTGFVLAGKPGLLCLEGTPSNIDAYMNEIKPEIGEEGGNGVERKFERMEEITDTVGEKHGARQNRGDMAAIENWLKEKGLGEMFESVILQS